MADVLHSDLTDPELHEPKGTSTANDGDVYVADGAGSGNWTQASDFFTSAGVAAVAIYQDHKSAGTGGGAFASGSWNTRALNTEVINNISANLSGDQVTLEDGDYLIQASAPGYSVGAHQIRFYNSSDAVVEFSGTSASSGISSSTPTRSLLRGLLIVSGGPKTYRIQHRCTSSNGSNGFGIAANLGETEVYTELWIWKIS